MSHPDEKAVVNPWAVEAFEKYLTTTVQELSEKIAALRGEYRKLGETWADHKFRQYAEEFERSVVAFNKVLQGIDREQIPYLRDVVRTIMPYFKGS